jgi:8-oxo-dGTP diphosphatase
MKPLRMRGSWWKQLTQELHKTMSETVLHRTIEAESYPGYPTTRLVMDIATFDTSDPIFIPDGSWTKGNDNLPTPEDSKAFQDAGYLTDTLGRPLHPDIKELITDPEKGVITGRGKYYSWGPNYTADPIVITREERPRVLLIKRTDTGKLALPGGFVDGGEDPLDAARREMNEEASFVTDSPGVLVYRNIVTDARTTAHSWAETTAYLFIVDEPTPVVAGDDAAEAKWAYIDELSELHGSHRMLIDKAMEHITRPQSIRDILNKPKETLETTIIDAGHMAYDHMFVSDGQDLLFVKAHDASRFTDPFREAHSRAYLEKEFFLFSHLAEIGYDAIPDRVDLIEDSLLAMDALHEKDGWLWRAPEDERFEQYVKDVLKALDELQSSPIPEIGYHDAIEATYETFWKEGWDDITDDKIESLVARINQLSAGWSDAQKALAKELIDDLPALRLQAQHIERDTPLVMSHNDARQSNIAWHPEYGARIVDWSWGDPAPVNADTTMFLMDLVKGGFDVSPYVDRISKDQLVVQIGFLLAHSLWNTRDGSTTVREQQVASASAAHRLLMELE